MRVSRRGLIGGGALLVVLAATICFTVNSRRLTARLMRATDVEIDSQADLRGYALRTAAPLYASKCAGCHGADLKGDPKIGAPNLVDGDWLFNDGSLISLERTIAYGIRSHHPKAVDLADMPAFGTAEPYRRYRIEPLKPGDVDDVVAYLFDIEGRGSTDTAAVERGRSVFSGRGQCFDCHSLDAEGDFYIGAPNLRDNIWLYGDGSRTSIARSIKQGRAGACPAWSETLKPEASRLLAVFIRDRVRSAFAARGSPSTNAGQ